MAGLAGFDIPFLALLFRGSGFVSFVKQSDLRRRARADAAPGNLPAPSSAVFQNLPDHRRVFHAGDDPHRTLALFAGYDVDVACRDVGQGREQERKL